jgi:hypothetical protein
MPMYPAPPSNRWWERAVGQWVMFRMCMVASQFLATRAIFSEKGIPAISRNPFLFCHGAEGGTRTPTGFPTTPITTILGNHPFHPKNSRCLHGVCVLFRLSPPIPPPSLTSIWIFHDLAVACSSFKPLRFPGSLPRLPPAPCARCNPGPPAPHGRSRFYPRRRSREPEAPTSPRRCTFPS